MGGAGIYKARRFAPRPASLVLFAIRGSLREQGRTLSSPLMFPVMPCAHLVACLGGPTTGGEVLYVCLGVPHVA